MSSDAKTEVEIRECTTLEELAACVDLQREVFALPEIEISPVRHFVVTRNAGGFSLGAYAGGQLVGFVLSVPAFLRGEKAFYSHMTAVKPGYQGAGIGARLKWSQREKALSIGVKVIKWTFEPVKARNAFFNLEKLGAVVTEYEENFYGKDYATAGPQIGMASDRLFAEWHLESSRVSGLAKGGNVSDPAEPDARISIPAHWSEIVRADASEALAQQIRIRGEFKAAFGRGLVARGFARDKAEPQYLLYKNEMADFVIDSDIRRAKTLPSAFYTDEANFELSKEKIFARTWQFAGRVDEFEGLKPFNILPDFLDEPMLLSRSADGVRCISNVCTHRGKILIEEPCKASLIQCGYHGRRFDLDGKFLSMPEFEGVEGFPSQDDDLRRIPLAVNGGFVFVSIDPSAPFEVFIHGVGSHFEQIADQGFRPVSIREYKVEAHWALYCENYLEGFHIPFVHQTLNRIVDFGTYSTETFRLSSLQTGYGANAEVAGRYLFIFPNMMFNFYPWGLSVNVVRPVTPGHSVVEFYTYVSDESKVGTGAGADLDRVELEDEAVVESVQRGIRSRFYSHGRYSPTREQGTHHFHRLIAEFMK